MRRVFQHLADDPPMDIGVLAQLHLDECRPRVLMAGPRGVGAGSSA